MVRVPPYDKKKEKNFFFEYLLKYRTKYHQSHQKHVILYISQFPGPNVEKKLKSETFFEKV